MVEAGHGKKKGKKGGMSEEEAQAKFEADLAVAMLQQEAIKQEEAQFAEVLEQSKREAEQNSGNGEQQAD